MPYEYRDHTSEAWLVGLGASLEEAFSEGAKALFDLMVDIRRVEPCQAVAIHCESDSLDTLFADFLNALLVKKDAKGIVFSRFELKPITHRAESFTLEGMAYGERFDPTRHESRTDVKAATYSGLSVQKMPEGYRVEAVVDL
jgi:SHS2 domain-containing protein